MESVYNGRSLARRCESSVHNCHSKLPASHVRAPTYYIMLINAASSAAMSNPATCFWMRRWNLNWSILDSP